MRLLLDTVTFIWAAKSPNRLSRRARSVMDTPALLEISSISIAEIAIKQVRNKLDFSSDDVATTIEDLHLRVLPYTANHAFSFFQIPLHHTDPFDRMLIAQALSEKIPVVTCDEKFEMYRGLKVIW
jgi:PIN domain nuclease of toxin-antitoxin system